MVLSKFLLYTAISVGFIVGAEIYHQAALALKDRLQLDEIDEIIFTRDPLDYNSRLTRHINFARDKTMHVTEMLENMILSARRSVQVAMFIFTSGPLATALINAHKNGVQVFVIVDHSMDNSSGSKIMQLKEAGIQVKICKDKTIHLKMCLIDVPFKGNEKSKSKVLLRSVPIPSHGVVISGSLNWTAEGLTKNEENFSVSSKPALCQHAVKKYFEIWNHHPKSLL